MDQKSLDDLLTQAAPRAESTPELDRLARDAAESLMASPAARRRIGLSRRASLGLSVGIVLTLGAGAAVAVPFVTSWTRWVPAEDLRFATQVATDAGTLECETIMRVEANGSPDGRGPAVGDLEAARAFLVAVDIEDYRAEARQGLRDLSPDERGTTPEGILESMMLAAAVQDDMADRGLFGGGVGLDTRLECPEP